MMHQKFSRRRLLLGTGLGAASLFLPSLFARTSKGQVAQPIKRLIIMTSEHGTVRQNWWMRRGNPEYGAWEYAFDDADPASFSQVLAPLHPRRADLLVLEGLSQNSTLGDRAINNHNAAHLHLLTGAKMVDDENAGGPSVDQIIAKAVADPDRIPSLEMATGTWLGGYVNQGESQRMPVEQDPAAVFDRLFPNAGQPAEPSERDKIRAAGPSVLDFVANEYGALAPKLSKADRGKLEMHRDMVRDLEKRIGALANVSCTAPAKPAGGNNVERARQFADLAAAAFACDLTRVATLQVGQLECPEFGAPPGDVHQDYAHQTDTDPNAAAQMTSYNRVHAELFLYLIEALAKYPDGDGTLLDHTAAVWLSELATGPHDLDRIPVVMAGSCAGYFRTGRYLSFAQEFPNPIEQPGWITEEHRIVGPAHSHLLVSMMQAMGLSQNQIGLSSVVTRDGSNTTLDLTGPLPGLT